MAEIWTKREMPASRAAFAIARAPKTCTASKDWLPLSVRTPTRLTAISAPRSAAASDAGVTRVGLDGLDLPDATEGLEIIREVRSPAGRHDPRSRSRDRTHDVPAEKAGGAEHRHLSSGREFRSGHPALLQTPSGI